MLTLLKTMHIEKTVMLRIRLSILRIVKAQIVKERDQGHRRKRTTMSHRLIRYHNKRKEKKEKKEGPEAWVKKQE